MIEVEERWILESYNAFTTFEYKRNSTYLNLYPSIF